MTIIGTTGDSGMKKILVLIIIFLFSGTMLRAQVLEGHVSYTVETARKVAFEGIEKKIDASQFDKHMQDRNYEENKLATKNKTELKDRSVQIFKGFKIPAYAVTYYTNPRYTYYYIKYLNQLAFVDIDEADTTKDDISFPFKTLRYDFRGNLIAVGLTTSLEERFLYKSTGKLISHWVGGTGYNAKGKKIGTVEEAGYDLP